MKLKWSPSVIERELRLAFLLALLWVQGCAGPSAVLRSVQPQDRSQLPSADETLREWPKTGSYSLTLNSEQEVGVYYSIPEGSHAETPILIVIPGARRNAGEYRDQWQDLSTANAFIALVLEGDRAGFPTEYEYNAGGVTNSEGQIQDKSTWLFSAIEPLFDDFKERFGSTRGRYSLYGHSAGGGFVHRFLLFVPDARVDRAVAANPAFFTMPRAKASYPFGLKGLALPQAATEEWLKAPLTLLLGEQDTGPRTKALSNSKRARAQGPSVYARGLRFFHLALNVAAEEEATMNWKLRIAPFVGHSNAHMASHAMPYLFEN